MSRLPCSLLAVLCILLASCIYTNVRAPLSYRSPTPGDVQGTLGPEVEGEACSHAVLYLVGWGDGGYSAAVADAKSKSGVPLLADVRADMRLFNVLGVYQKRCTRVQGRAVR